MIVENTKVNVKQKTIDRLINNFFKDYFNNNAKKLMENDLGPYAFLLKVEQTDISGIIQFKDILVYGAVDSDILCGAYTIGSCIRKNENLIISYSSTHEFDKNEENIPAIFKNPVKINPEEWFIIEKDILNPSNRIPENLLKEYII